MASKGASVAAPPAFAGVPDSSLKRLVGPTSLRRYATQRCPKSRRARRE